MQVLVTGGTGFIGNNLLRRLRSGDHTPVALIRDSSPTRFLPEGVDTIVGDITDMKSIESALADRPFDAVAHLAAVSGRTNPVMTNGEFSWEAAKKINVDGSVNVFRAADQAGLSNIVFASTVQAHPDLPRRDESPYIRSKIEAEQQLRDGDYAFGHTTVYPTAVIGPYDYRLRNYQPFQLVQSNPVICPPMYLPQTRNFVHVDNVTSTILKGLSGSQKTRYLVTGRNVSNKQFHKRISSVIDSKTLVFSLPFHQRMAEFALDFFQNRGVLPVSSDVFDWETSGSVPSERQSRGPIDMKGLRAAIEDTYEWYRELGLL